MLQDRDLLSVQEARDMVRKARVAFEAAKLLSQEQIDKIVKAMSDVAYARRACQNGSRRNQHGQIRRQDYQESPRI